MEKTDLTIRFGNKIRELRKAKGLSQEDFADLCGFDRTYVSGIERGTRNPTLKALEILANALEVAIEDLFKGI